MNNKFNIYNNSVIYYFCFLFSLCLFSCGLNGRTPSDTVRNFFYYLSEANTQKAFKLIDTDSICYQRYGEDFSGASEQEKQAMREKFKTYFFKTQTKLRQNLKDRPVIVLKEKITGNMAEVVIIQFLKGNDRIKQQIGLFRFNGNWKITKLPE